MTVTVGDWNGFSLAGGDGGGAAFSRAGVGPALDGCVRFGTGLGGDHRGAERVMVRPVCFYIVVAFGFALLLTFTVFRV
eukprot:scaffold4504_cov58-Cyclotella_meneghiniana.AAC.4